MPLGVLAPFTVRRRSGAAARSHMALTIKLRQTQIHSDIRVLCVSVVNPLRGSELFGFNQSASGNVPNPQRYERFG
jgi:hypothetical protein